MNEKSENSLCDADPSAINVEQARERIFSLLPEFTETETIDAADARGRVLAETVVSAANIPPFRCSAMDGFAFRHGDGKQRLKIAAISSAGHPGPDQIGDYECHRIMTGARVSDAADTVVQQENVAVDGESIVIQSLPVRGMHVRDIGSDCKLGDELLASGSRLYASELALLAAHGVTRVSVLRKLKVGLLSTGDELLEPGDAAAPGCIVDANRPLLKALLSDAALEVVDLGIAKDSQASLNSVFKRAAELDAIVSSGGVSVGDADHVRDVLESHGELYLWKIAMKPGRPLTFGLIHEQLPYFGLPGNPVSSAVTCMLFVLPALRAMLQQAYAPLPMIAASLAEDVHKLPGRVEYQRGILARTENGEWKVSSAGTQDSHVLHALHKANCLIELALESSGAKAGEMVLTLPFAHLGEPII